MSNYFNNKPFKPTKVGIIKAVGQKIGSLIKGKGKVSPTIKSVKPTTDISGSVKRVKSKEYTKRIDATNKSKSKIDTGRKMMREGQKELKRMVDTKRAFKFKSGTTKDKTFPIEPGKDPKKEHKGLVEESKPQKRFYTGKELEQQEYFKYKKDRVKKMGGGFMGRRMGYKGGSNGSKKGKVPTTPKEKSLAKLAPPRDRITFGDVVAGRTKGKA